MKKRQNSSCLSVSLGSILIGLQLEEDFFVEISRIFTRISLKLFLIEILNLFPRVEIPNYQMSLILICENIILINKQQMWTSTLISI